MASIRLNLPPQSKPAARLAALEALIVMIGAGRFLDLPNGRLYAKLVYINPSIDRVGRQSEVSGGMPFEKHLVRLRESAKRDEERRQHEAARIGSDLRSMSQRQPARTNTFRPRLAASAPVKREPSSVATKRFGKTERDREKRRAKAVQDEIRDAQERKRKAEEAKQKAAQEAAKQKAKGKHQAA
ncbi:hypothetical protein KJ910_05085 [Patescibacteria group bacterium]|nr:hypothetical protein [Patescibacteria group bacterium]MBU1906571.1 hypothetical protein [Patescibacteria group bacterium]